MQDRPAGRRVMRQQWRDLLFLHWEVSAEQLRPLIPAELSLDTYEGKAYVGLVPFTMRNVRPIWSPPVAPLSNFHETNVRAYVHLNGRDPGVWFFSLDAANAFAARLARAWFKLPYFYARMSLEKKKTEDGRQKSVGAQFIASNPDLLAASNLQSTIVNPQSTIEYATQRLWPEPTPAECRVTWTPEETARHAEADTLEHFLIERYVLYAYRNGRLYSGRVHHAPYPVRDATVQRLEENLIAQAGITRPDTPPLIHCSNGVDVDIFPLKALTP